MKTRIALLSFLFLALAACSRHYRTGDAGVDGTQLNTLLEESLTAGSTATSPDEIQRFRQIFNDPNTTIYFAESNENFGNAFNVAAIYDWNFLGQAGLAQNLGGEVFTEALQHARVFFLDLPYEDRIQSALLIDINHQGNRIVKIFLNDAYSASEPTWVEAGELTSHMTASDGAEIIVRSYDVDGDLLQSVIQLQINGFDSEGSEVLLGKIATLVGFGGAE